MYHVIYLTGAPASGKSTLTKALQALEPNLFIFSYADELAKRISERQAIDHVGIRQKSGQVVTYADVEAIDNLMLERTLALRESQHVIIDSHAITKEEYGYRATPFTIKKLKQLNPTMVVCLIADSETTRNRITKASLGRPEITRFESDFHTYLQAAVAFDYGFSLGIPMYYLDGLKPTNDLAQTILSKIKK